MKQAQYASDVPQLPGRLPARKASATATRTHTAKYQKTSDGQYGLVSVLMIISVYNMTYYHILYIYTLITYWNTYKQDMEMYGVV